jgi:hypothetical protein
MSEGNERLLVRFHLHYKERPRMKYTWKEHRGNERTIMHNEGKKK